MSSQTSDLISREMSVIEVAESRVPLGIGIIRSRSNLVVGQLEPKEVESHFRNDKVF